MMWPLGALWQDAGLVLSFNDGNIERTLSPIFSYPGSLTRMWNDHFFFGRGEDGIGISVWSLLETVFGPHGYRRYSPLIAVALTAMAAFWACLAAGRSRAAAVPAAVLAAFCGWTATSPLSGLVGRPMTLFWAFLAVAALELGHRRGSARDLFAGHAFAGAALGLSIAETADIGAFFALTVASWWFFCLYSPSSLVARGRAGARSWGPVLGMLLCMILSAALVSSHTLVKMVTHELGAAPSQGLDDDGISAWDWATQWSLPVAETVSLIVPDAHGASSRSADSPYWGRLGQTPGWQPGAAGWSHFKLNGYAVGIAAALLWMFLLFEVFRGDGWREDERRRALWSCLAVAVTLTLAWGRFFVVYPAFHALPFMASIRNPEKWLGPMTLALVFAVAYGTDRLIRRLDLGAGRRALPFQRIVDAACLLAAVACVGIVGGLRPTGLPLDRLRTATDVSQGTLLVALATLGLLAFGLRAVSSLPAGRRAWAVAAVLTACIAGQLLPAVEPFVQTVDYSYLKQDSELTRTLDEAFAMDENQVGGSAAGLSRLKLLPPRDPVLNNWRLTYLASRMDPLFDPVSIRTMPQAEARFFAALAQRPVELWKMTGIRWFLATPPAVAQLGALSEDFQVRKTLTPDRWDPRLQDPQARLTAQFGRVLDRAVSWVELEDARPPLRVVTAWKWASDSSAGDVQVLTDLANPESDLLGTVWLQTEEDLRLPSPTDSSGDGVVRVLDRTPTRLELKAEGPGLLFRAAAFDRRWRVEVDGEPAPLLRANYLFQAVPLTEGKHRVVMEMRPDPTLFVGSVVTRILLLVTLPLWLWAVLRRPERGV